MRAAEISGRSRADLTTKRGDESALRVIAHAPGHPGDGHPGRQHLGDDVLEVGPGPGLTTELLRFDVGHLTAVELDADLAADLATRLAGTNVEVINGDATELPFDDQQFTAVVSCNMLHHIPTVDLQNRMFAEGARVLRAGGLFVATDCVASDELAAFHHEDIYNPIDPATLHRRLTAAGFTTIDIRTYDGGWAVHAHLPVG